MSTSLYAITNTTLNNENSIEELNKIVTKLNNLTDTLNIKIENDLVLYPFKVSFHSSSPIKTTLYSNICVIETIYRYNLIYANYHLGWFKRFRNELYEIVKVMGGTEIIYLAYGTPSTLSRYLEDMAWKNVPYEKIKESLIQEFGQPIKDYSKIIYTLPKPNEFFLDDFKDLK